MRRYDFKNYECDYCQALMTYDYFKRYHTEKECNMSLMFRLERETYPNKEAKCPKYAVNAEQKQNLEKE